jgi:hypothetical protein
LLRPDHRLVLEHQFVNIINGVVSEKFYLALVYK